MGSKSNIPPGAGAAPNGDPNSSSNGSRMPAPAKRGPAVADTVALGTVGDRSQFEKLEVGVFLGVAPHHSLAGGDQLLLGRRAGDLGVPAGAARLVVEPGAEFLDPVVIVVDAEHRFAPVHGGTRRPWHRTGEGAAVAEFLNNAVIETFIPQSAPYCQMILPK
jgi:hypothetical protein